MIYVSDFTDIVHTNAIKLFVGATKGLSRTRIYKEYARIEMF